MQSGAFDETTDTAAGEWREEERRAWGRRRVRLAWAIYAAVLAAVALAAPGGL